MRRAIESVRTPDSDRIIIYQKPSCSTCRKVYNTLVEAGVDFESVDYSIDPIPPAKLSELLKKMHMRPRDILRTKDQLSRDLHLEEKNCRDAELVDLISRYSDLMQRPVIERGSKAILARPAERLRELF